MGTFPSGRTETGTSVAELGLRLKRLLCDLDERVISGPNIYAKCYAKDHASGRPGGI